jgi:hypothetical protein
MIAAALGCGATLAIADPVTDWNAFAVTTVSAAGASRPGPSGILDLAMVHAAIHDAVQAYEQRFESYNAAITGASGSPVAALSKAARDVLVTRFPAQAAAIDAFYNNYLAAHSLLPTDAGTVVGQQAAIGIINRRANDGSFPSNPETFVGGTEPGQWRPTPPAFAPMAAPWLGTVTPFALKDTDTLLPEPPPPQLRSGEYAQDYDEVMRVGSLTSTERTAEQTDLAYFYSGNIIAVLEQMMRTVAIANVADMGDTARLFALANFAMADAVISAWANKRTYFLWRPSTAINNGDDDANDRTTGDPNWKPLIVNPPYPDYTSGANSFGGAVSRTLKHFFGTDDMTFVATSVGNQGPTSLRTYHRFSDIANDLVEARIYLGIHFRFADTVARRQGRQAADSAFAHVLRPVQ